MVQAISALCQKYPRKHAVLMSFLFSMLREEVRAGGLAAGSGRRAWIRPSAGWPYRLSGRPEAMLEQKVADGLSRVIWYRNILAIAIFHRKNFPTKIGPWCRKGWRPLS